MSFVAVNTRTARRAVPSAAQLSKLESARRMNPDSPPATTFQGTLLQRYRREIATVAFAILFAWFVYSWILLLQRMIRYYTPFPAWDYWRAIYDAAYYKKLGMQIFLRPHNEHRILFPEIVYQLDTFLLHGRLVLPIIVSFLCYLATFFTLAWITCRHETLPKSVRAFAVLLAGIVLGWQGSAVVIDDPFLLQWTLSSFCVLLSLYLLARRSLAPALVLAVIATYSSANCLLFWPVLIAQTWFLRLTRRQFIAVIVTAIASIGFYFINYHPGSKVDLSALLLHPLHTAGFIASYIGMPFGLGRSDWFDICLGTANVFLAACLFIYARRKRMLHSETLSVLFCLYVFLLLTALITTIGRINLAPGYGDAKASRFWVVQLINWADVTLLCVYFTAKAVSKVQIKVAIYMVMAALTAFATVKLRSGLTRQDDQFATRQLAALSFENGLQDEGLARRIFPHSGFVLDLLPFLEAHHLSVYSLAPFQRIGKPVETLGKIVVWHRPGAVVSSLPVEGGVEFVGWTEPDHNGSENLVFLNEKQSIVGYGRKLRAGLPDDLHSLSTPVAEAWVGFINLQQPAQTISPYFLTHGRLQEIGSPLPVDTRLERVAEDRGRLISGIRWHSDPAWTKDGFPPLVYPTNLPWGATYGSWSGDDRKEGEITTSAFDTPAAGCLLLPVLHGPSVDGLSVHIDNADTGLDLQTIPMQNGDSGWQFWKINLDHSARRIRVRAEDEGSGPGQWLAIGQPSECDNALTH